MTIKEANEFVSNFHRHNKKVQGAKFAIGLIIDDDLIGVGIVGRPVARMLDDGYTAEVTRVCVVDNAPKGSVSKLYSQCWQICRKMGYNRVVTYTLKSESGASLRGAGWKIVGEVSPGNWNRNGRERKWDPIYGQLKFRWEMVENNRRSKT